MQPGHLPCTPACARPSHPRGSRKRPLIPLNHALSACDFQFAAELRGLFVGAELTDHGAVVDAPVAEIGALDHRRPGTQHVRELALQRPVGGTPSTSRNTSRRRYLRGGKAPRCSPRRAALPARCEYPFLRSAPPVCLTPNVLQRLFRRRFIRPGFLLHLRPLWRR